MRTFVAVTTLACLLLTCSASAHVGGVVTRPVFSDPVGVIDVTQSDSVVFRWEDDDTDPTGVFHFFYHSVPGPSIRAPDRDYLDGVEFATAQVSDESDTLTWDLSEVPPGAYHVYVETIDPPLCYAIRYAPALVIVRPSDGGAADTPAFGALFTSPSTDPAIADGSVTLEVVAVAPEAPRLAVQGGGLWPARADGTTDDECIVTQLTFDPVVDVVDGEEMEAAPELGADMWRSTVTWNTEELAPPPGAASVFYFVRAEASLTSGESAVAFVNKWVEVLPRPEPQPEGGPTAESAADTGEHDATAPGDDSVGPDPSDEASPPDPADGGSGGGCGAGQFGGLAWLAWLASLLCVTASRRQGRHAAT